VLNEVLFGGKRPLTVTTEEAIGRVVHVVVQDLHTLVGDRRAAHLQKTHDQSLYVSFSLSLSLSLSLSQNVIIERKPCTARPGTRESVDAVDPSFVVVVERLVLVLLVLVGEWQALMSASNAAKQSINQSISQLI